MGSVSTTIVFAMACAFICRLQASPATCCTTRRTETSVAGRLATNWAAPCERPEAICIQAMPSLAGTVREAGADFSTASEKFTGTDSIIRFLYPSKTKATPLIASGFAVGTREGRARKFRAAGFPGVTKKTLVSLESPERNTAT